MARKEKFTDQAESTGKPEKKKADKALDKKPLVTVQSTINEKIDQCKEFFQEAKAELKKVTWPTRKETVATGIAVMVLTFIMALFLGIADLGLTKIVELILS